MKAKNLKYKIGYCQNKYLKGVKDNPEDGHYVLIRKVNKDGTCDVNTFTSLEKNGKFRENKIKHIKHGLVYPIPKNDANFTKWTGCTNHAIKNVKITDIKDIGKKKIKQRHLFYIGKYLN